MKRDSAKKLIISGYIKGCAYLFMCAASVVLAVVVHDGFFALLSLFSCSLAVACAAQLAVSRWHIRPRRIKGDFTCTRGDDFILPFCAAGGALKAYSICIAEYTFQDGQERRLCAVSSQEKGAVQIRVCAEYVGSYNAGVSAIYVSDILGLFMRRIKLIKRGELLKENLTVLPAAVPVVSEVDGAGESVDRRIRLWNDSAGINGPRQYEHGDELRTVDWKTTARKKKLYVKDFSIERCSILDIVMMPALKNDRDLRTIAAEFVYSISAYAFTQSIDRIRILWGRDERLFSLSDIEQMRFFLAALYTSEDYDQLNCSADNALALVLPSDYPAQVAQKAFLTMNPAAVFIYGSSEGLMDTGLWSEAIIIKDLTQWKNVGKQDK